MKKKLAAVLAIAVLVLAGASAQLMLGVSGALPMDSSMSATEIKDAFTSGDFIMYGGFLELGMGNIGFGASVNTYSYYDSFFGQEMMVIDGDAFVSYHLFKAKAFLDPFAELGFGILGSQYASNTTVTAQDFLSASYYWYAAAGVGINLGPIGIFGKFAYNYALAQKVSYDDEYGNPQYYAAFDPYNTGSAYIPAFRITLGAKLIL